MSIRPPTHYRVHRWILAVLAAILVALSVLLVGSDLSEFATGLLTDG
ncbi:hypothetical protein GCM10011581_44780 [Saccharopolyspora subtropica]|uniref:Uncharacterized protein n=1 Tax=Saccharopolyspora thermophila TaxID=89367 RepID=A0A917K9Z6_9PSEU|nr:hypothetical protein [Saccharopolyspora subtropica]GGJ02759.1 hypothetical protein GCM10011581_44780 [Saccharopolyspora subtropica]